MTSMGTGYDYSTTTISPDGRIFQVEYAGKAMENSGTAIGVRCKDGIVLGVEKLVHSKLLTPGSNRRIGTADLHVGVATAGLIADGRQLLNHTRAECNNYKNIYRDQIPGKFLAERMGLYVHTYTLYSSVRPFGAGAIIGVYSKLGPEIYMIEPSGIYWGYNGTVIGKGKQNAKTQIEKLDFDTLTCRQAIKEVAKIIYSVHDDAKDKEFELELSWISDESKRRHELVPKDLFDEAERYAKDALNSDMNDD